MNEKSKKSHSKYRKSPNDFAKTVIAFVVTAIIIIVGAIIAVNKPACNLVHKLEADMPIGIRDIEIDQSQNTLTPIDSESLAFGSHIANITCEKGVLKYRYIMAQTEYHSDTAQVCLMMKSRRLAQVKILLLPDMTKHILCH